MDCTHPVLYSRNGKLYCHICGAVLPLEALTKPKDEPKPATDQREGQEEKQAPKRKRKAKGADGNENH